MAVKVCINGQMKRIDTTLHKPVIFLNGQKRVLDKAWTFINGEKVQLWGQEGVQIDYIKADGLISGITKPKAIGSNWLVAGSDRVYYENINRIDISNLSNPTLVQQVGWGTARYNGFKSQDSGLYYFDASVSAGTTSAGNELTVNPENGVVSVVRSNSTTQDNSASFRGTTNSYFIYCHQRRSGQPINRVYGSDIYFNTSLRVSIGTTSDWYYITDDFFTQVSASDVLANTNKGLHTLNYNGITQKSSSQFNILMLDGGDLVCQDGNKISLVDKDSLTEGLSYTASTGTNLTFVGRNGNFYYIVERDTATGLTTLKLLRKTDFALSYVKDLPSDPFGDEIDFWASFNVSPIVSKSGFLAIGGNTSGQTRIVRFSSLL